MTSGNLGLVLCAAALLGAAALGCDDSGSGGGTGVLTEGDAALQADSGSTPDSGTVAPGEDASAPGDDSGCCAIWGACTGGM